MKTPFKSSLMIVFTLLALIVSAMENTPTHAAPNAAQLAVSSTGKAMTWSVITRTSDPTRNIVEVGCWGDLNVELRPEACNAYTGDTSVSTALPILCLKKENLPVPPGISPDFYNGWTRGTLGLTAPMVGSSLIGLSAADFICEQTLGSGYKMAEFHDGGGGWDYYSYGNIDNTSRFWVYINDQCANPWGCGEGLGLTTNILIVTKTGNGTGAVTSAPAGLYCGSDCTEVYASNTNITLTATPDAGSTVAWSGCDSVNGNNCSVTMSQTRNVVATFTVTPIAFIDITGMITADNAYQVCLGTSASITSCVAYDNDWYYAEPVTLNDVNLQDYLYIAAWSDNAVAQALLAELSSGNISVRSDDPAFRVFATGEDLDITSPPPSKENMTSYIQQANNTQAWASTTVGPVNNVSPWGTIAGIGADVHWAWYESGNCPGSGSPFEPGCNHQEYLIFRLPVSRFVNLDQYALAINEIGNGTVTVDKSAPYYYGDVVHLTATADAGWAFGGWDGACTASPCSITMDGNKSVTATFVQSEYTLTVISDHGVVTKSPDQPTYHEGDVVTLTAAPNSDWHFENWTGAVTGGSNPVSVTIHGNTSVTANYAVTVYKLTVQTIGSGSGVITSDLARIACEPDCQEDYPVNTEVTLTASPASGSMFFKWVGAWCSGTNPVYKVKMDQSKKCQALFLKIQNKTLTSIAAQDGWVTPAAANNSAALYVGDNSSNQAYRATISYKVSLPSNAVISTASLRVCKRSSSPVPDLGVLNVYAKTGYFGSSLSLARDDFSAAPSLFAPIGRLTSIPGDPDCFQMNISPVNADKYIPKNGTVQFRIQFSTNSNNNKKQDVLALLEGAQLTIQYVQP